jgi:hypothetical protein
LCGWPEQKDYELIRPKMLFLRRVGCDWTTATKGIKVDG